MVTFALHVPSLIVGMILMLLIEFAGVAGVAILARKPVRKP